MDLFTYSLVLLAATAVALALFLPRMGVFARWKQSTTHKARSAAEDALKHAYDCEHRGIGCTVESIAGALSLSVDHAARLAAQLESMGLMRPDGNALRLTPEGRSYALRIIRIHRLWERYLADETSVREADWHLEAERQEHRMTAAEADVLAAQLGNPQLDPHGDPIPTAAGEIPELEGDPLTSLRAGAFAKIVHVEDEPHAIYAQLIAEGLHAGMVVQVIENSSARVRLEANGEEVLLAPMLARNLTVTSIPEERRSHDPFATLASLRPGGSAVVTGISRACRGQQRRRLMDLGIVPGTTITAELSSLTGNPMAYRVRGTLVALRKEQAEHIVVNPVLVSS
jgi:DtxR family transcriptional regulator, Mn-dependent transcriptional regulator